MTFCIALSIYLRPKRRFSIRSISALLRLRFAFAMCSPSTCLRLRCHCGRRCRWLERAQRARSSAVQRGPSRPRPPSPARFEYSKTEPEAVEAKESLHEESLRRSRFVDRSLVPFDLNRLIMLSSCIWANDADVDAVQNAISECMEKKTARKEERKGLKKT
jgi:hypothetical protein